MPATGDGRACLSRRSASVLSCCLARDSPSRLANSPVAPPRPPQARVLGPFQLGADPSAWQQMQQQVAAALSGMGVPPGVAVPPGGPGAQPPPPGAAGAGPGGASPFNWGALFGGPAGQQPAAGGGGARGGAGGHGGAAGAAPPGGDAAASAAAARQWQDWWSGWQAQHGGGLGGEGSHLLDGLQALLEGLELQADGEEEEEDEEGEGEEARDASFAQMPGINFVPAGACGCRLFVAACGWVAAGRPLAAAAAAAAVLPACPPPCCPARHSRQSERRAGACPRRRQPAACPLPSVPIHRPAPDLEGVPPAQRAAWRRRLADWQHNFAEAAAPILDSGARLPAV